ncbi:MAG: YraN family protein [Coriobacteriia bacterium]|nr:YraN family protein [Coriobacteriia bacterium]
MSDEKKKLGQRGEDAAAAFLERNGFTIIARNWRCTAGEIDIVALDGQSLVLCEVKTRRGNSKGTAEDAVTPAKQRRYARLAEAYLQSTGMGCMPVRFDVVTLAVVDEHRALLRHHRAAFSSD